MPEVIDDKSQHCIPFLLNRLKAHQARYASDPDAPPFFLGLNGVQGAGKTVLVSELQKALRSPQYSLSTVIFSLDDIYLTHADQLALAKSHPNNPLLQHRGQPSTHDLRLGKRVFESLRANRPTAIPQYDKSAFAGQGDRVPEAQWEVVNTEGSETIKVVIFEGWCVGFRPLDDDVLRQKWNAAVEQKVQSGSGYDGRLGYVKLEDVQVINDALREYDGLTDQLDTLIHIDAQNTRFVYDWRQEQERTLRAAKGTGMTEEQVNRFVDGYYPSYELFTETLRKGVFASETIATSKSSDWQGRQLRLVVDKNRRVQEVIQI
ncbi:P-loop containing nucleoside triphosphate hydrolase protein [Talaromyces proteolyticus]|uniref:P-loop containing nucleoside triphosphate hydrolase protein n=1 Tax=Talaromyces proteolyticus TaxID=1131652 RepID=A0AAD4Q299_9EURO|nr:P-loop containing nucleoside triphosphate hydrolase protein [Talaromyces proteolyticus]KAH8703457.1 P-loop containing nucleoside triphosphate hydrolase protein [Talaromyces proteolyticus]